MLDMLCAMNGAICDKPANDVMAPSNLRMNTPKIHQCKLYKETMELSYQLNKGTMELSYLVSSSVLLLK
jgi:hypothetical protein